METFRCPTCVAVLIDPSARRCAMCKHRLRRRNAPHVLGEEHRIDRKLLPVDHWMRARIDAPPPTTARRRRHQPDPLPWAGRFVPSERAESTPASPAAQQWAADIEPAESSAPLTAMTHADPPAAIDWERAENEELEAPATITLVDDALAAYLPRPAEPESPGPGPDDSASAPPAASTSPAPPTAAPAPAAPLAPFAADPIEELATELDPEVQAIVDDLYLRARAELSDLKDQAKLTELDDKVATSAAEPRGRTRWHAVLSDPDGKVN